MFHHRASSVGGKAPPECATCVLWSAVVAGTAAVNYPRGKEGHSAAEGNTVRPREPAEYDRAGSPRRLATKADPSEQAASRASISVAPFFPSGNFCDAPPFPPRAFGSALLWSAEWPETRPSLDNETGYYGRARPEASLWSAFHNWPSADVLSIYRPNATFIDENKGNFKLSTWAGRV